MRGKCREFPRKWFTFPRGRQGHRLHRPLWPHSSFPPPGKVPGFPAKTVHFPPWPAGVPAHRPLWPHSSFPPPGKVPGIPAILVHFPPGLAWAPAPQASLAALAIPSPGESAGFSCENASSRKDQALPPLRGGPLPLEPRAASLFSLLEFSFMSGHRFHRPLSRHLQFPPPGKVPRFPANSVHFPPCLVGPLPHSPLSPHLPSPPTGKVP